MSSALCDSVIQPFGCVFNIFVAVKCALSAVPCERMACAVFHFRFCVLMMMISVVCVFFCVIFLLFIVSVLLLSMMLIDGLSGHLSHCNRNIIKQMKLHKADKMLCPLLHFTQFSLWSNRKDETNVRARARLLVAVHAYFVLFCSQNVLTFLTDQKSGFHNQIDSFFHQIKNRFTMDCFSQKIKY